MPSGITQLGNLLVGAAGLFDDTEARKKDLFSKEVNVDPSDEETGEDLFTQGTKDASINFEERSSILQTLTNVGENLQKAGGILDDIRGDDSSKTSDKMKQLIATLLAENQKLASQPGIDDALTQIAKDDDAFSNKIGAALGNLKAEGFFG